MVKDQFHHPSAMGLEKSGHISSHSPVPLHGEIRKLSCESWSTPRSDVNSKWLSSKNQKVILPERLPAVFHKFCTFVICVFFATF